MPLYKYTCTAAFDDAGNHVVHDIDIPQERVDGREGFRESGLPIMSRMGNLASPSGQPPQAIDCPDHGGWAILATLPDPAPATTDATD